MDYDYDSLVALGAVVREGGFDAAAKSLAVSQSAVSQRIKQLEQLDFFKRLQGQSRLEAVDATGKLTKCGRAQSWPLCAAIGASRVSVNE